MFENRIKELRTAAGMTQSDLAQALGVKANTVSMWESGKRKPDFEALCNLSEVLQRSIDYILCNSDDSTPRIQPTEEKNEDSALCEVEEYLTEYGMKYARLDEYGRKAVEAIIRAEFDRCHSESTLRDAETYKVSFYIKRC